MPVKTKPRKQHHTPHKNERRTQRFLKVYAPYIPLLTIVSCGIILSHQSETRQMPGQVKNYATNVSQDGLLEETNKRRAAEGLQPLRFNPQLKQAAQSKAEDMKVKNYWAHTTPTGEEPWDFIGRADYPYRKAAENLAFGFDSSKSTLNGWMNSPGHRANVLDPELYEVGFGISDAPNFQGHGEETIVVAMYGQAVNSTATPANAQIATSQPITQVASTQPQQISYIQSLTNGKAPWSGFIAGLTIGGVLMYMVLKHVRAIRRAATTSENFVIHHPLFDATLIALLVLMLIISQTIGSIY